jgi:hypothetical protein
MPEVLKMKVQPSRAGEMAMPFVDDMPSMEAFNVPSDSLDSRMDFLIEEVWKGIQDPKIQQLAARIMKEYNVPSRDFEAEASAVFNWVRENIRYTRDPDGLELFRKPIRTVQLGIADCDDMSILIAALLGTIGHKLVLRVIGVTSDEPEHIYPLVLLPPDNSTYYIALDATRSEDMGWEVAEDQRKFQEDFDVEEDE